MICKNCGAVIRHNEEYCRKCGSLVINFKKEENKNLKNICIENSVKGKLQGITNKFLNEDKKQHDIGKISEIQNRESNISDFGEKINKYVDNFSHENSQDNLTDEEILESIKEQDNKGGYQGIGSKSMKDIVGEFIKILNTKRW